MKIKTSLILAAFGAALLLASTGCVSTEYAGPNGVHFKRTAFMNKQSIGKVEFDPVTGKLKMEGYSNEQTEVAAAVAQAVASALAPVPKVP